MNTKKNKAAVALGRMARGKPKHITQQERARRAEAMKLAQAQRWQRPAKPAPRLNEGEE